MLRKVMFDILGMPLVQVDMVINFTLQEKKYADLRVGKKYFSS